MLKVDIIRSTPFGDTKVRRGATTTAQNTHGMRIVNHQTHAIFLAKRDDFRQGRDVAFHTEESVNHQKTAASIRQAFENPFEMFNIVVSIALDFAMAQAGTVIDAGVVFFVQDDDITPPAYQRADCAQVDLHAGRKIRAESMPTQSARSRSRSSMMVMLPFKKREPVQLVPYFFDGINGGFSYAGGMSGESQIVVGATHDDATTFIDNLGAFVTVKGG